MRVSQVSFGFTKNLGNFQSQRVDATIDIGEGEDPDMALALAVAFVKEAQDLVLSEEEQELLRIHRTVLLQVESERRSR